MDKSLSPNLYPFLPLRGVVVYPQIVHPLFVAREKSIKALKAAMATDKKVVLAAQKQHSEDDPRKDDVFMIGTVATVLQLMHVNDGTVKVLVEGIERAQALNALWEGDRSPPESDLGADLRARFTGLKG